ncbi:hypothetical protein RchiOBHm_Chr7g0183531 [Rosa chinensis]|uniref:Uncharacterized protein n=1 Tax=Rosa chinensis TaxID=74649 RepID=A0A2P6P397_ROSCH|nr:hypothetical protein RchiOBHm_Chr7g0183531 [Rosa chinensis]
MYNILVNNTCSLYRLAARRKIQALPGRQPNSEVAVEETSTQICFLFPFYFFNFPLF